MNFLIGLERELRRISAVLRTSVGPFLFLSASFNNYDNMMKIPTQVISGIGFLGAGTIDINDNQIRGLNTDATIWCVAAIGVLTG